VFKTRVSSVINKTFSFFFIYFKKGESAFIIKDKNRYFKKARETIGVFF